MIQSLTEWIVGNKTELLGAILGIFYVFFSIRQNILTWPTGILTSLFYIVVFYKSAIYAAMSLQVYYVIMGIYGWFYWIKGKNTGDNPKVPVQNIEKRLWINVGIFTVLIFSAIIFILSNYSDSDVPVMDSLTTTLSIVATWMLAKKYIENWIIWILVDLMSGSLYFYKNLWPTVVLFVVYTVMAFAGYFEWKKDLIRKSFEKLS